MPAKFLTAYGDRKERITPAGEKLEHTYGYEINKYGQKVLMINGETDVYAKVQESLEETKIENILARAAAGEEVFRPDGIYGDMTEAPKNLIEARRMMQNLETMWTGLPKEIREKYNNDVEMFIGASGSQTWLEDMGIIQKPEKQTKKTEEPKTEPKKESEGEKA